MTLPDEIRVVEMKVDEDGVIEEQPGSGIVTDEECQKALTWLVGNARNVSQAIAECAYLQEYRKSLKAMLMGKAPPGAVASMEAYAYAHPDYQAHLKGMRAAIERAEYLKFLSAAAKIKFEVWRTNHADMRVVR
mgnify:CR=1 FL=1